MWSNKIYDHGIDTQPFKSILPYDRVDIDNDVVNDMNYYRHWGIFGLKDEPSLMVWTRMTNGKLEYYIPAHKDINDQMIPEVKNIPEDQVYYTDKRNPRIGTKSLFNNVNAVAFQPEYAVHANAPLIDSREVRKRMRDLGDCSIKALVNASQEGRMGRAVYDYNDFMFCKYLGQVSNNYLITLRRFPFPAGDNINLVLHGEDANEITTQKHMPDVGRLVTWMGTPGNDLENILKYKVLMPYKELTSTIEQTSGGGEGGGIMGTITNLTSPAYAHNVYLGRAGSGSIAHLQALTQTRLGGMMGMGRIGNLLQGPRDEGASGHMDRTKNYGPVDVIAKTHIREGGEDGGLRFEQDINLTFDYELRSYDNINTRAAFLDLLANILAVTYVDGRFWGGAYMGTGVSQNKLFSNLPIYNLKQPFNFGDIYNAGVASLKMIATELNGGKPITGTKDIVNAVVQLGKNMLTVVAGGLLNGLGRPQRQAVNSLLTNAPVGLWHLTIGNPKHPIMSMGNMILDDVNIQHYGRLGLDDFPVGLRVSITLKHGMPRDAKGIEHMYMMGDSRIYQHMDEDLLYMYEEAQSLDTKPKNKKGGGNSGKVKNSMKSLKEVNDTIGTYAGRIARMVTDILHGNPNADVDTIEKSIMNRLGQVQGFARIVKQFGTNSLRQIIIAAKESYKGNDKISKNS